MHIYIYIYIYIVIPEVSIAKYFSLVTINGGMEGLTRIVFTFLFEAICLPKNEFNLLDIISTNIKYLELL